MDGGDAYSMGVTAGQYKRGGKVTKRAARPIKGPARMDDHDDAHFSGNSAYKEKRAGKTRSKKQRSGR
jgi:hypothetical protein